MCACVCLPGGLDFATGQRSRNVGATPACPRSARLSEEIRGLGPFKKGYGAFVLEISSGNQPKTTNRSHPNPPKNLLAGLFGILKGLIWGPGPFKQRDKGDLALKPRPHINRKSIRKSPPNPPNNLLAGLFDPLKGLIGDLGPF